MTFAIIETGGKQYKVSAGDNVRIEKIEGQEEGKPIVFDKVLLVENEGVTTLGMPHIAGATVLGTVTRAGRAQKVTVIHYKQKSRYFKKAGHRQCYLAVKIDGIKSK